MRESNELENDAVRIGSQLYHELYIDYMSVYCTYGWQEITAWRARGAVARVSVNFCKFSPCVACAARPRGFDSLPSLSDIGTVSEARFILRFQAEVSKRFYSSKANGFNVCDFSAAKNSVQFCDIEKISASHTQNLSSRYNAAHATDAGCNKCKKCEKSETCERCDNFVTSVKIMKIMKSMESVTISEICRQRY